jgi:hypothetical protein
VLAAEKLNESLHILRIKFCAESRKRLRLDSRSDCQRHRCLDRTLEAAGKDRVDSSILQNVCNQHRPSLSGFGQRSVDHVLGSHVFCVPHQENRLLRDGNPYRSETPLTVMILSIALFIRLHPNWLLIWRPRKQLRIRVPVHDPPSCLLAPKYHRGA